jgi:hypothetical protein
LASATEAALIQQDSKLKSAGRCPPGRPASAESRRRKSASDTYMAESPARFGLLLSNTPTTRSGMVALIPWSFPVATVYSSVTFAPRSGVRSAPR